MGVVGGCGEDYEVIGGFGFRTHMFGPPCANPKTCVCIQEAEATGRKSIKTFTILTSNTPVKEETINIVGAREGDGR